MASVHFVIKGDNKPKELTLVLSYLMDEERPLTEPELLFITTKVMMELASLNDKRIDSAGKGVSDE